MISARSTGRSGSIWKPPGGQQRPCGVGTRRSSGRIALRYVVTCGSKDTSGADARPVPVLRRPSGRPALSACQGFRGARRPRRRRRSAGAGDRAGAGVRIGVVCARRGSGAARRCLRRHRGVHEGAGARQRRQAWRRLAACAAGRRRREAEHVARAMCGRCSTNMRRASTRPSITSATARPRCCALPSRMRAGACTGRPSSAA